MKAVAYDPFRPHHQPAQAIYDAFQAEASKRKQRSLDDWIRLELEAVQAAAAEYADEHGLQVPTMAQVESAETYARGSVDYGAKWAYALTSTMIDGPVRAG